MKILWIPHTAWHVPQREHLFCRALAERHEVHVTDCVADFTSLSDYLSLRYLRNFTYRCCRDGNITVHSVPRISPALYVPVLRHFNTAIFSRIAQRIIKQYRIDVVVSTFLIPPPKAPRLIYDLFDDNVMYWNSFGHMPGYADEIARIESSYFERADAVVAASSVLADKARMQGVRGKIYQIPNGVNLCLFQDVDCAKARARFGLPGNLVGSVANHDKLDELNKVIDAAKILAKSGITILIAGRGTAMQATRRRVQNEGVSNVLFQGYIPPEDAPNLISALDVGMCTYMKSAMDDARSPMRLLLYAAAGLPTVCTDLEEVRRMQFPNVVLVEDNAKSLAAGIKRAFQLPRARPPQLNAYDLQNLVPQYEAIIEGRDLPYIVQREADSTPGKQK